MIGFSYFVKNSILFIVKRIYKYKMFCKIKGENKGIQNISSHIKTALLKITKL